MNKKIIILILKIIVSAVLIFLVLHKINFKEIINAMLSLTSFTIITAVMINLFAIVTGTVKWRLLLPDRKFKELFLISIIGRYYSMILPGQIAGEGAKAYLLGKNQEYAGKITASVIIDKITGIIGISGIGVVGIIFSAKSISPVFTIGILTLVFICIIFLFSLRCNRLFIFTSRFISYFLRFEKIKKVINHIINVTEEIKKFAHQPGVLFLSFFVGCIYQLSAVLLIFILSYSLQIEVSFFEYCWIFCIVSLALILPVTIAGLGVREITFLGLLGWLGIQNEKALALSFAFLGIQIFDAIIGGFIHLSGIYKFQIKK